MAPKNEILQHLLAHTDEVERRLTSIDKTLAAQHETLKDHVRRTEILEGRIDPIEKKAVMLAGMVKLMAVLGGVITLVVAAIEGWHYLSK